MICAKNYYKSRALTVDVKISIFLTTQYDTKKRRKKNSMVSFLMDRHWSDKSKYAFILILEVYEVSIASTSFIQRLKFILFLIYLPSNYCFIVIYLTIPYSKIVKAIIFSCLFSSDCKPRKVLKRARNQDEAQKLWKCSWDAVGLSRDYNPFVKG